MFLAVVPFRVLFKEGSFLFSTTAGFCKDRALTGELFASLSPLSTRFGFGAEARPLDELLGVRTRLDLTP